MCHPTKSYWKRDPNVNLLIQSVISETLFKARNHYLLTLIAYYFCIFVKKMGEEVSREKVR